MDPAAESEFTAFVAERTHALFRMAYALTGEQHAAEDLVQNALARLALYWLRINTNPEAYVRQVMYREHASLWRRMWRRRETAVAQPPEQVAPDADHSSRSVQRLVLQQALLRLPPRQRAVVVLRYLEDRSEQEVAELLGCAPGTVASQASRALAKLRRTLNGSTASAPGSEVLL